MDVAIQAVLSLHPSGRTTGIVMSFFVSILQDAISPATS